jgi:hypothetical protein
MKYRFIPACLIVALLAAVLACSKSSPTSPTSSNSSASATSVPGTGAGSGFGKLTMRLKDSPFSDAKAFLVTFSEVSVHASGGSWQKVDFADTTATSRTCDLKQLQNGATDILGVASLPAGHYTQIRLTVTAATLYFDKAVTGTTSACTTTAPTLTGRSAPVKIPSGDIKLNREFDLADGATLQILLDFDGDKSVNQLGNGNYQMSPVISVVSVQ